MILKVVTEILTRKESIHFWNAALLKKACELIIWNSYFFLLENLFQMMDFWNIQFSLEEYLPLREKQHLLDFFLVRNKKYERVRV